MGDTTQLVKDYQEKRSKLEKFMKNPQHDASLLSNSLEFRDKNIQFFASGGTRTSKFDKLENHPFLGYPYKRGVKRVIQEAKANEIHYEPHVEAGGGEDLYGICTDIDEFSKTATIVPITNNFEGYLVAKDATPKAKDKLIFNKDGALEKVAGAANKTTINAIALSDAKQISNDVYLIKVAVFGNKAVSKN
ncbi:MULTISPECIES: DUF228 domain-containing protein [Borreliella]|uniref:Uncharacterized protein n=11 Tax=Borreliella TaxID=64895 RepID=G0ISS0_BORAP|nr:DUF228 domain-containing protein [Borreliella bavariensis]ACJ73262.1 lyme disease protein of unknown function [Borreliella afzelii ACA-1]AEL70174.1 conserved hypothetical protein [Borreliella afzelii PKo]AJY73190.1 hypothetical protein BAFK78_R005 [Borreliella afzelii K78]ACJ73401.1 lyme disease protein of unknown function [Borreliella afzelii ACA-1]ACJ73636.1 lyme disease protein of unknown function [Borreliella afzelii ACA-1]